MLKRSIAVLMGVSLVILSWGFVIAAGIAFPAAGLDEVETRAVLKIECENIGEIPIGLVQGPTIISRSDPSGNNDCTDPNSFPIMIDTEITSLSLMGGGATVELNPNIPSIGKITQKTEGMCFPANSFFDVYVKINTPLGVFYNQEAATLSAMIDAIPPFGEEYLHDFPITGIELFDYESGQPTGCFLVKANHTSIELASFNVEADDGTATVTWETGTEIDNAGFNLYRATSPDGPWLQINTQLIPAEGDPVSGASYTFVDQPGRGNFYYQLEDIDYNLVSTQHDLVKIDMGSPVRLPWYRPALDWLGL